MPFAAYVFDAYGTLFDVHAAVRRHATAIGPDADRLSEVWRVKQLEYSWVHTLMDQYSDFWTLTEAALDFALAAVAPERTDLKADLLDAYRRLDAYPEVLPVLLRLKATGARLAILSNGSPAMLNAAVVAARLGALFEHVISVDALQRYKTDPAVYRLAAERLGLAPEAISYQSANRWDIAGATVAGFRTVWIRRGDAPDEYDAFAPALTLPTLDGLLEA